MPVPTQNACLAQITDNLVRQGNTILAVSGGVPKYTVTMITPTGTVVNQPVTVLSGACRERSPNGTILF